MLSSLEIRPLLEPHTINLEYFETFVRLANLIFGDGFLCELETALEIILSAR